MVRSSSRFPRSLALFSLALAGTAVSPVLAQPEGSPQAGGSRVVLVAGGDVEWSRATAQPDIYFDNPAVGSGEWIQVPFLNSRENRQFLADTFTRIVEAPENHHLRAHRYHLDFESATEMARHPFQKIAETLREADIAFINLETPLSDTARWKGAFRTPTVFAEGLAWAGIDVANIANNHALDAEGEGLLHTIAALERNRVGKIGGGRNLQEATRPFVIERNGRRFAFLGYAQFENSGTSSFAQGPAETGREAYFKSERSGIAPLDPHLIERDIAAIRSSVDFVIVSFHWAIENSQDVHPAARKFAHRIIEAGADVILGHHPHVPRGVEIYQGKPIFYCFGNFIFGHNHSYWKDNYLARLTFGDGGVELLEVLPLSGQGDDLAQPYLLTGERAAALLEDIRIRSGQLDTRLEIEGDRGVIRLSKPHRP